MNLIDNRQSNINIVGAAAIKNEKSPIKKALTDGKKLFSGFQKEGHQ